MMARACWQMRRQLSAFHDGELPVSDQIALQAHLRECPECAAEVREMDDLGTGLRAGALAAAEVSPDEWEGLPSMVVSRMKAEDAQSFSGMTGRFFEDMHLFWAVLGATGATVACLALIFTIFYFGITSPAGSNLNPMVMNARMNLPSAASNDAFPAEALPDQADLALALDAVVTREGRIAKLEVIQPGGGRDALSPEERQAVLGLLDAISKARFEPARYAGSRVPVAVNMVWLYASLTVKAKMPELQIQPKPSRSSSAIPGRTVSPRIRLA